MVVFPRRNKHSSGNKELKYLYQNAVCFVYPSLYEGFGIPILEAFTCGCPAILANASCFPEIAGDAAIFFDPNDERELALCINKITEDNSIRLQYIERGYCRVRSFKWDTAAEQTMDIYRSLAGCK